MLLLDKFFKLTQIERISESEVECKVRLIEDCDCYRGHFPGKPVSPGVCNIEMIRECAEAILEKDLFISNIKQCRLTAVSSPAICPALSVNMDIASTDAGYAVKAKITDDYNTYMEFKGQLIVKQ